MADKVALLTECIEDCKTELYVLENFYKDRTMTGADNKAILKKELILEALEATGFEEEEEECTCDCDPVEDLYQTILAKLNSQAAHHFPDAVTMQGIQMLSILQEILLKTKGAYNAD